MNSDFNTPLANWSFFKLVKYANQLAASERLVSSVSQRILPVLNDMFEIFGLEIPKVTKDEMRMINGLIQKREMLRNERKFQEADAIRKDIAEMGIVLIDHKKRTLWMKQERIEGSG